CVARVFFILFVVVMSVFFFFSSRRRHTRSKRDWSSDVCSSDLSGGAVGPSGARRSWFSALGAIQYGAAPTPRALGSPPKPGAAHPARRRRCRQRRTR